MKNTTSKCGLLLCIILLAGCDYPRHEAGPLAAKACADHGGLRTLVFHRNGPWVAYCADGASFVVSRLQ